MPALACTTTASRTNTVGPYSPAAVKAGKVPAISNLAGINCPTTVLVLLSNNYIRATFSSQNNFLLKPASGTDSISYTASIDSNGTYPITQGATIDYMQNNVLNLLGLLGGSSADLPFYIKPTSTSLVAGNTYTDLISVTWDWYLCTINLAGACIGTVDKSTTPVTTQIRINLTVTPNPPVVVSTSTVTWDPINNTSNPKSIPGSKRRLAAVVSNPDIVALDTNTVVVRLPTPSGLMIAPDGDGTNLGSVIQVTQGSTATGLTLNYVSPSSTTDDVDFSSDNGTTWTYVPDTASDTSKAAVTDIRLRFQGSMAASSSLTVTVPYSIK
ncbi:MAG: hypothetical protein QM647_14140 [Asticcacaulis sp.]|uniref:hypothetical protein n=1 Tax=Asticcacaulis sp. TaxID=1872648 RepID=UPI0039E2C6E7